MKSNNTKIDQLISDLCPNGVKSVKLGEVCEIYDGTHQTPKYTDEGVRFVSVENINALYRSNKFISRSDYEQLYKIKPRANDVFMTRIGSIGSCTVISSDEALAFYVTLTLIRPDLSRIDPKYLKYIIESSQGQKELRKRTLVNATPIKINLGEIGKIEIPVPPLIVQKELVKILDIFTELEEELEAELKAELEDRKKQYYYYRSALLKSGSDAELKELRELGYIYGGLTGKSKEDFQDGNAKFVTYMNVYSNMAVNTNIDDFVRIAQNEKQNRINFGDVLFTGSSETPDECGMSSVLTTQVNEPLYLNSFCFGFRLHDVSLFKPDFLKHLFRDTDVRRQIAHTASGVTRFNVSKKRFAKIKIPVPDLETQNEIVEILDSFTALEADLEAELKAELKDRKKKYEYYRNKLLTFKEYAN